MRNAAVSTSLTTNKKADNRNVINLSLYPDPVQCRENKRNKKNILY